ncbi:MAG TPA: hypothetical protein VIO13_01965 [Candidatus Dormibacteraeota bacterium]
MSVAPVAITWAVAGLLAAVLLPRTRRRRLAALVPLAAAVAALLSQGGGPDLSAASAPGGLLLGRPASGLVLLCALATTLCLVLSRPPDTGEILVTAACGSLSAVALASGSPLIWGVCFVAGTALFGVRWVAAAPARATLAAARVATLGAATLLAASPFLPVDALAVPPRAHLAGALLAGGIAAGFGLVPLGGWVIGGSRLVRGAALAPWALLLLPALLFSVQPLQSVLPPDARTTFGAILLPAGAVSALWAAERGLSAVDGQRYSRILLADLGLVAMGLATPQPGARLGSLLLMLTHLCVGPLLVQDPASAGPRPRCLAWAALSGAPPSPAFWGRFALLTALTSGFGGALLLVTVPVTGAVLVIALRATLAATAVTPVAAAAGRAIRFAAWVPPLAALTVGLLPGTAVRTLLGVG